MRLSWDEIQANAVRFSKRWKDARNEEAEGQAFQIDLLRVFGVSDPLAAGDFEYKVPLSGGKTGYIDYLWKGKLAVEMKSRGKDLSFAADQLQNYMRHLPEEDVPDLWLVCDFENIRLCRRSTNEIFNFKTKDLRKHIKKFADIAGYETERVSENQIEVNVKAAEKMARLHDALKNHGYGGHDLEVYLVRLLFCLFADDTGIFPQDSFSRYIENSKPDGSDLSDRIARLFEVLNMTDEIRAKKTLLSDELKQFRYINGGLFDTTLPMADFDAKMRRTLLDCVNFDWNKISPAIFGAMFQGVMDKGTRRELGAHYTSEENILKLINPLFMDDLWKEFDRVKIDPAALGRFHDKISRLKFLDPACGCGNFLIITYRELRLLELEILKMLRVSMQLFLDVELLLKVSVEQFYGIELEDFPCQIAQTGMWLMDHQMNLRVSDQLGSYYVRLPLTQSATIIHGNALRIDWEDVVPKNELSFIMGNPPFGGYSNQTPEQKADILSVYTDVTGKPLKTAGKIDYVAAWHYKASKLIAGTQIRAAFVSTNSITQGEQAAAVWKPLFEMFGVHIDFCHRTFKWSNEAKGKAAVHCVITGISAQFEGIKRIYDKYENNPVFKTARKMANLPHVKMVTDIKNNKSFQAAQNAAAAIQNNRSFQTAQKMSNLLINNMPPPIIAKNINPYLVDAPNVFIESRTGALCASPNMIWGNKPVDGGSLIIEANEYDDFITREPLALKYIKRFVGAEEYINKINRYCLWLVEANPSDLRKMPLVMARVERCKQMRLTSSKAATRKSAETPTLFQEIRQPDTDFIVIPSISSERRQYIPIGFMDKNTIVSNLVHMVPGATLYHFGILTSSVHMAWVRAVCGRLEMRYRYSKDIVYNNFPWPDATGEQQESIAELAQGILDARAAYPDSSLADLYDPLTMPPNLLKAHKELDKAVMKLYGFSAKDTTETEIVAELMERYRGLAEGEM